MLLNKFCLNLNLFKRLLLLGNHSTAKNIGNDAYLYIVCVSDVIGSVECGYSWWRHQLETVSALLAPCEGNSSVTGGLGVFFDINLKNG